MDGGVEAGIEIGIETQFPGVVPDIEEVIGNSFCFDTFRFVCCIAIQFVPRKSICIRIDL